MFISEATDAKEKQLVSHTTLSEFHLLATIRKYRTHIIRIRQCVAGGITGKVVKGSFSERGADYQETVFRSVSHPHNV